MFEFNRQIIKLIDNARTQPKTVARNILNNFQEKFNGTQLYAYGKIIDTFEGIQAVKDFQIYMRDKQSINPLIHSKTLDQAAQLIAQQKGSLGKTESQKPKVIYQKIQRNGKVNGKIGQLTCLCAVGPQQIANYFLIDDGLASRKRRRMLLDPVYKYIGVGHSAHKEHEFITVILLVQNLEQNDNYLLQNSRLGQELRRNSQKLINEMNEINQENSNSRSEYRQSNFY